MCANLKNVMDSHVSDGQVHGHYKGLNVHQFMPVQIINILIGT